MTRDPAFVGTDRARPEVPAKVAGRTGYIHDLVRPGMLYGKIKFAEIAHARIVHLDTSAAMKVPGVRAVITGYDTPKVTVGFLKDNCALKRDKVRQHRDEIAAVAAIDPDLAQEAVDKIRVEYEPLPAVFDPLEALEAGAPLIHALDARGRPITTNLVPVPCRHQSGDLEGARRAAKHVVEGRYSVPLIQQSCMGTAGCIAELDPSGNLTMWAKTQIPFLAQRDFNRALEEMGLAGRNSRVIVPALGGGFGTGLDTHCYEFIAILLAHATGAPVKMLYDREQEFAYLSPRQSARTQIRQGCDENGRLLFREIDVLQDNGAYTSWGATFPTVMLLPATSLYRVPAVRFDARIVYTNNTYCQAMRGYGNPEVTWAIESSLDALAEKVSIDPVELRRLNSNQPGETTPMGLKITTCGLPECLDSVAEKLEWSKKRGRAAPGDSVKRRGVGLASLIHVGGSGRIYRSDASGIILKADDYGNINVYYGGVEMGQGLHSALTMMVADAVGVRPERVFVNETDTGTCPWDVGTHASRGAFMAGNAAILAAKKLREKLFALAEEIYPREVEVQAQTQAAKGGALPDLAFLRGAKRDRLELRGSMLFSLDAPDEAWAKVELGRLLRAVHFRPGGDMLTVEAFYDPPSELPDWSRGMGNMSATYTFGVQGVEVEVDEETGEVKLLHLVNALDVGKVLNLQTLRGQIYGGIAQGIGYALYEEVKTDRGRILNPGFTDYKLPTAAEMSFPIDLVFIETNDPAGPFGAKGVGEPGLVPTAPAIANAIYDAVGVRVYDLPITPEKVLAAIAARDRAARRASNRPD
ncbi:MAG: xanthine dehydrogenase family protein molybdopterin-binding subunit [Deltaproteobacteria bacterium]|nr:xanthine dehydrogenase family protein molybdopterin-binding subunit [Deltaproteobacteria bacterium]